MNKSDIKVTINGINVSPDIEQVTWSGGMNLVARTLTIRFTSRCRPDVGDKVRFWYQGWECFRGIVLYVDVSQYSVSVECADYGIYLNKSYAYKVYKGAPNKITRKICREFGIPVGTLYKRSKVTKVTSTGNMTLHKVIEQAYEGTAVKPKRHYLIYMWQGRLNVDRVGSLNVATVSGDIETATSSRSIKDMVNQVIILDDNKKKGSVSSRADKRKYGTFQQTYTKQKGVNANKAAKQQLNGLDTTSSLSALGNPLCISGRAITVNEPYTGMTRKQIIQTDRHTFSASGYTMQLEFYHA